jgi:Protein of unknown function (DUF3105)
MANRARQKAQEASRREKATAMRRQQQVRERRRRMLLMAAGAVAVLLIVGGVTAAVIANRAGKPSLAGVASYSEKRDHLTGKVNYPQTPPAGGPHSATVLNCGIYDKPVPNENAVHDLEHGAVWITYRPDLPATQVATLRSLVRGRTYLTLSPYPGLPAPVVASAWGKQIRLTGAGDSRLEAFINKYRASPQAPEPGSPCDGGIGTPIA